MPPENDTQMIPVTQTAQPLAQVQANPAAEIQRLMDAAIRKGLSPGDLEKFIDLHERVSNRYAEQQFDEAFARFKADCPPVARRTCDANPKMMRLTKEGIKVPRMYASLEDIAATVDPVLTRNGLSYAFGETIITGDTCLSRSFILRHIGGGRPRITPGPPIPVEGTPAYMGDRNLSSASPAQRYGVADTYTKRYAMVAGLSITTCDEDTDGARIEEAITQEQVRQLNDLLIDIGPHYRDPLLKLITARAKRPIETLDAIPASEFDLCVAKLESKRAKK